MHCYQSLKSKIEVSFVLLLLTICLCAQRVTAIDSSKNSSISQLPYIEQLQPTTQAEHDINKTMNVSPLHLGPIMQIATLRPMRLEASYSEPISLREAMEYAFKNSLPIKVARESWNYQYYQFWGNVANGLPSFSLVDSAAHSIVYPETRSNSRVFQVSVRYPVFQGGNVLYTALAQYYRQKGWLKAYDMNINDALLDAYQKYTNLQLNESLLHIRSKSVEVSELQLELNKILLKGGTGTKFAVMQSETQLASDRQALLQQQVALRQAALALAFSLNVPMAVNLVPSEDTITEQSIVDEKLDINYLLNIALVNRPELRQYELFRIASARNIQVAASPLYPTAAFSTTYSHSSTSVYPTENQEAAIFANAASSTAPNGSTTIAGAGVFGGLFNTFQAGFNLVWTLNGMGLQNAANILSAVALSNQALLQANQELLQVTQQVRLDYLTALTARQQIDVAATGVASAQEELRLANLRLRTGVGTNLELIQAQRDYINALVTQAQAIIASNQAQAQLLHDTGVISVDTLTTGYNPNNNLPQKP